MNNLPMDEEIDLLAYWGVIVKRKWLIVGLIVVMALLALLYSLSQPKMYKATATIMLVDNSAGGLVSTLGMVAMLGGGMGSSSDTRVINILQSMRLAKEMANTIDIKEYFPKIVNLSLEPEKKEFMYASCLRGAVNVKPGDGLLYISVIWTNPKKAADLANLYVDQLGKFLNQHALNVNYLVIDPAMPPLSKFKPKTRTNVIFGGMVGGFLGIVIAFLLEYFVNLSKIVRKRPALNISAR